MRYTVIWESKALNELANLWNNAADRRAVTNAVNYIENQLRFSPEVGHPLGDDYYLVDPPVVVSYSIDPGDRKVIVTRIGRW
jgi:hypothetical protein